MKKYTIIGDPHVTPKNLDKIKTLFSIVEDIKLPVIWLGDFLDTKEVIRGTCLNLIHDRLLHSKLQHIILVGNHDFFNSTECEDHALKVLKSLDNVIIIDEFQELANMWFVPYMHDLASFRTVMKKCKGKTAFIHQGIDGFDYGNGHIAEGEVDISALKGVDKVISGHFHKYQEKGNLTYLGTPFSHSFGETDQVKYIGIFNTETDELQLLETPFPRHRTLEIDCDDVEEYPVLNEKDMFRMILKGARENIKQFPKEDYPGVKFIERPTEEESNVIIGEESSNEEKFITWAKEVKDLDKDTIKLGLELLEQAR